MSFEYATEYGKVILAGVVGSRAQGFATENSDYDRGAVFLAPILDLLDLERPDPSVQRHGPDVWMHELSKFVKLAMTCNPTILELLWLPEYEIRTTTGYMITDVRQDFLSRKVLYNAYRGYARQQLVRAESELRTTKARRHALRLMLQGYLALRDGVITVEVSQDWATTINSNLGLGFTELYQDLEQLLDSALLTSPLPTVPNFDVATKLMHRIRTYQIQRSQP